MLSELLPSVHVLIAELHFELRLVGGYTRVPIGGVGMPPHTPALRNEFCSGTVYKEARDSSSVNAVPPQGPRHVGGAIGPQTEPKAPA